MTFSMNALLHHIFCLSRDMVEAEGCQYRSCLNVPLGQLFYVAGQLSKTQHPFTGLFWDKLEFDFLLSDVPYRPFQIFGPNSDSLHLINDHSERFESCMIAVITSLMRQLHFLYSPFAPPLYMSTIIRLCQMTLFSRYFN